MAEIHHYENGAVVLYRRACSGRWQARLRRPGGRGWHRITTGHSDLDAASAVARERYQEARVLHKHGATVLKARHSFRAVAEAVIAQLEEQVISGRAKATVPDYIRALRRYHIPFFGARDIGAIGWKDLRDFDAWRAKKANRPLKKSTINLHNVALRMVFRRAKERAWCDTIPDLSNNGAPGDTGSWFEPREISLLLDALMEARWDGRKSVTQQINHLVWHYVVVILATGMRPGTEAANLRWRDIERRRIDGADYMVFSVRGKTGPRQLVARDDGQLHDALEGLRPLGRDGKRFDARPDDLVFLLPIDRTKPRDLHGAFERRLKEIEMLLDRQGRRRTLYSLRHTYATTALLAGVDMHTLAVQMGTSQAMIERHYSHLTPLLKARELATPPIDTHFRDLVRRAEEADEKAERARSRKSALAHRK